MDVALRLREARKRAGYASATEAALAFGWTVSTYLAHENGTRGLRPATARRYARAFGVSPAWLLTGAGDVRTIPLVGYVGAGAEVFAVDDLIKGAGLEEVEAPPGAADNAVAVRVRGDSMYPRYDPGDVLIYSEHTDPTELVGRECVCRTVDGRTFVKTLAPGGDGRWTLLSFNAPPIVGVHLEWAAEIEWVKRR